MNELGVLVIGMRRRWLGLVMREDKGEEEKRQRIKNERRGRMYKLILDWDGIGSVPGTHIESIEGMKYPK